MTDCVFIYSITDPNTILPANSEFLGNSITSVAPTAFSGSTAINVIDLSSNKISSWNATTLNGLANLTTLSLANNSLTKLEANTFSGAPNLVVM